MNKALLILRYSLFNNTPINLLCVEEGEGGTGSGGWNYYLLSIYYEPGMVLSIFLVLLHLILFNSEGY